MEAEAVGVWLMDQNHYCQTHSYNKHCLLHRGEGARFWEERNGINTFIQTGKLADERNIFLNMSHEVNLFAKQNKLISFISDM